MAGRGPRQLAQAASHRDQDMGAAARRARRRGVAVDRDPGRGQAQTRVLRGSRRRVHGPGMASGRGPGRFRRGRRALQGRGPAHAPFRAGLPVLEHRPGPAHARRERGMHVPGAAGPVRMARRRARTHRVRQRRGRGTQDRRRDPLDPPVPGVPGALRVRELPVLAVRRPREGRGGREGRHGPPQAVRAQAERVEPGELQLQAPGQVPGTRREAPPRQGRGGGGPVRRGPRGPAAPARQTLRRGHVETHEDRQVRRGHARRQAPLLHGRVPRATCSSACAPSR